MKKCERCLEPKIKRDVENLVTYQKQVLTSKEEATIEIFDVKILCDDCLDIVIHAASTESWKGSDNISYSVKAQKYG